MAEQEAQMEAAAPDEDLSWNNGVPDAVSDAMILMMMGSELTNQQIILTITFSNPTSPSL